MGEINKDIYNCRQIKVENIEHLKSLENVLLEVEIQDKMIDMLCELLEESGPIYKICDEVPTDDCSLECETCIKDIIRKKVMEE